VGEYFWMPVCQRTLQLLAFSITNKAELQWIDDTWSGKSRGFSPAMFMGNRRIPKNSSAYR